MLILIFFYVQVLYAREFLQSEDGDDDVFLV